MLYFIVIVYLGWFEYYDLKFYKWNGDCVYSEWKLLVIFLDN